MIFKSSNKIKNQKKKFFQCFFTCHDSLLHCALVCRCAKGLLPTEHHLQGEDHHTSTDNS